MKWFIDASERTVISGGQGSKDRQAKLPVKVFPAYISYLSSFATDWQSLFVSAVLMSVFDTLLCFTLFLLPATVVFLICFPWTQLVFFGVCIYCLSFFRLVCLYCTILGFDPRLPNNLWVFAFCLIKHCTETPLPAVSAFWTKKPFPCISGTDRPWQELEFRWRTVEVLYLVWKKRCVNVNFSDILWVCFVFPIRLKDKAAWVARQCGGERSIKVLDWISWSLSAFLCSPHICIGPFQVL